MNSENFKHIFESVADFVLRLAGFVREPFVPGLVVTFLVVALLVVIALFVRWSQTRIGAVAHVRKIIVGDVVSGNDALAEDLRSDFYDRQPVIAKYLSEMGLRKSPVARRIAFAWREYRETLKVDADTNAMLNGIRPSVFFNTEDLDAEARGWKVVPGLFVSFGLAATFFGLIAALQQTGETLASPMVGTEMLPLSPGGSAGALQQLLLIASAKFIMSLTGLVCSIIFTIVLRRRLGKLEHAIDLLCIDIEKRVGFIALESLAFDQKKLMEEQKEHSQSLNTELIAAFDRALNSDLPKAISASISEAMAPMMSQVGQAGMEGVSEMIGDLSNQFSGDVAKAMGDAAERFDSAAGRIEELADALRGSAGDVNGTMEKSILELASTIGVMRDGLADGANATKAAFEAGSADVLERMSLSLTEIKDVMSAANKEQLAAAGSISEAARSFAERVDVASENASEQVGGQLDSMSEGVSTKLTEALQPLLLQAQTMANETSENVVKPVRELTSALEGFVGRLEQGSNRMDSLSNAIVKSTDATSQSAGVLGEASGALKQAADPMEQLARGLTASARATAAAATDIAGSLDSQRDVVNLSMQSLKSSLEQFQSVIERYDDLDEKLGTAFIAFRTEVDSSIQRIGDHADGVHVTYADALSQLRAVVDQAAEFRPVNQR